MLPCQLLLLFFLAWVDEGGGGCWAVTLLRQCRGG
jgi:hypothetical protein